MTDEANQHQNTPSAADLDAQLAADEAARKEPDAQVEEPKVEEPEVQEQKEDAEPEQEKHESDDDFEKRIARIAFEKRRAEKEARELRRRIEELEGRAPPAPKDEEMQRQIEQKALEMAKVQQYNDRANSIYQQGCQEFQDFPQKIAQLRDMGVVSREFVEAADESGDAAKVLYYLSKNLDQAEQIASLPVHKMGVAMGKLVTKLSAPPPVKPQSKAPPPIKPVSGAPKRELGDMEMSIEEYMRREDERQAKRRFGR